MIDDASSHLSCYTSTHASIWHRYGDMATHKKSTPGSRWSHRYGPFEILPGKLFQEQKSVVGRRSVLNITLISYRSTPLRYIRNVAREE